MIITSDQLGLQPFLEWLAWFMKNLSRKFKFNQSDIDSHVAALTLMLSVNGPLNGTL